ncbi:hypothetical protein EB169_10715 [archaeon]|jgi:hypothetical protein|nr:hypothetical protein [archaeon]
MWIIRLKTFLKSLFWHIYSGSPKATQLQILKRYEICIACSDYDTKSSTCNHCGCNINNKKQFLNKLAWADQKCPIDKWLPVE